MLFRQQFRNFRRAREVLRVLSKYGFEDVAMSTWLRRLIPSGRLRRLRDGKAIMDYTRWERVRLICEELGATFIKGAQVMANRPDLLPDELLQELQKLQHHAPPFPYEQAKAIIERETKRKLEDIFESFEEVPIGAASIGQVHRGRLRSGEEVVIKVQRPEVAELITTDLEIIKELARRSGPFLERNGIMSPTELIDSFDRTMKRELQYSFEVRNIEQFRNFYKGEKNLYIPRAFREYCTDRVMVLEYVDGVRITDVKRLREWDIDPEKVAQIGLDLYLRQIFEYGYFHADPHPGNVLVLRDGRICLIDFGMVGSLLPKDKRAFAGVFISMAQREPYAMTRYLRQLCTDDNVRDMNALTYELHSLIEDFASRDVQDSSMAELAVRLQRVVYDYRLRMPGDVFLILRALAILEGIGKEIYPSFNTWEAVKPFGRKLVLEAVDPRKLAADFVGRVSELDTLLTGLPLELRDILEQLRRGKFEMESRDPEFTAQVKRSGNRLTEALLLAGMFSGSALLLQAGMEAQWVETVAKAGIGISGWISLRLLWRIWRGH